MVPVWLGCLVVDHVQENVLEFGCEGMVPEL